MTSGKTADLAEKLRVQIMRMVAGNGLPPEAISLMRQQTATIKIVGQLDTHLAIRTENSNGKGSAHPVWQQSFEKLADLSASIVQLQNQLTTDPARLQLAADEILRHPSQGWGIAAADIGLESLNFIAGCEYTCGDCEGTKMQTCATCQGRMRQDCNQCFGKRETNCPTCLGRGVMSSGENCAACRQRGVVMCFACQGHGEIACSHCAGKGQVTCKPCEAQGTLFQQTTFKTFAQPNFKMLMPDHIDDNLTHHIRRLKPENLLDGRATINITGQQADDGFVRIHYTAEFPIRQYQFQLGDVPLEIVTLGHKDTLFDVPNFMDRILAPSLDLLRRARRREIPAINTLKELGEMQFYRRAFKLGDPKSLRRQYPFGISTNLLREVPPGLHYLLSILTEQPRMLAALGFNAVSAILLLSIYVFSGVGHQFSASDAILWLMLIAFNAITILLTHFLLSERILKPFGLRPNMKINHMPLALGKTGLVSLCATLMLCLFIWLIG
jgi:hypothetical protein